MKIKLTEEQYRKFVLEDTNRSMFMDRVYKEIQNKDIREVWPLIVDTYGFSVDEVINDDMLYHLIGYKMLDGVKNWGFLGFNPRPYRRYINAIAEKLSDVPCLWFRTGSTGRSCKNHVVFKNSVPILWEFWRTTRNSKSID